MLFHSHDDVAQTLLDQPILHGLTIQDAQGLASVCDTVQLSEGEILFREGDEADELFLTLAGRLHLTCAGPDGVPMVVGTVSDGGVLGEMGVFGGAPRSATAVALMPSTLLRVPGAMFPSLIEQGHPAVRSLLQRLRQVLSWRLRALNRRMDAALSSLVVGEMALAFPQDATATAVSLRLESQEYLTAAELAQVPILHRLDERALSAVAGVIVRRAFSDGDYILCQGATADGIGILLRGEIRVVRRLPRQGSVRLVTLSPGAVFGFLSAIDGLHRAADCIADGPVECGMLSFADFSTLMDGESHTALQFQMAILQALFIDLREANARFAEMAALPTLDPGVVMLRPE